MLGVCGARVSSRTTLSSFVEVPRALPLFADALESHYALCRRMQRPRNYLLREAIGWSACVPTLGGKSSYTDKVPLTISQAVHQIPNTTR